MFSFAYITKYDKYDTHTSMLRKYSHVRKPKIRSLYESSEEKPRNDRKGRTAMPRAPRKDT